VSVTLPLERKLNWSGLLIEAEPNYFDMTVKTRRNTTFIPACLSLTTRPKLSAFNVGKKMQGKIVDGLDVPGTVNVQCLPIYSILLAVNRTTVDVFSLDIEGNELDVLQSIPFDKVDIKVRITEYGM
jgi:Methyltransferase FkbM domain